MAQGTHGFQPAIFDLDIGADEKNPSRYAVHLGTGGLGLPDRDYYLDASLADKKIKYQAYIADMLKQVGWPHPEAAAKAVVDMRQRSRRRLGPARSAATSTRPITR